VLPESRRRPGPSSITDVDDQSIDLSSVDRRDQPSKLGAIKRLTGLPLIGEHPRHRPALLQRHVSAQIDLILAGTEAVPLVRDWRA
jgi:hypothetical protein